jgi:hypothetical protein
VAVGLLTRGLAVLVAAGALVALAVAAVVGVAVASGTTTLAVGVAVLRSGVFVGDSAVGAVPLSSPQPAARTAVTATKNKTCATDACGFMGVTSSEMVCAATAPFPRAASGGRSRHLIF